jgi:hypothetical protein
MAHTLILGVTESGKTTLGRQMAQGFLNAGSGVLVMDPINPRAWPASFASSNRAEFQKVFWNSRNCYVFVDEAGHSVARDEDMVMLATAGRHAGHSCFFLAQRCQTFSATVRDQCSFIYLFSISSRDSDLLAEEFNQPGLRDAVSLHQGEYFFADKFGTFEKHTLFTPNNPLTNI